MGRPKAVTDPDAIAYAVNAVIGDHRSYREVAAELVRLGYQVSHATVKRWCDDAKQKRAAGSAAGREPSQALPVEPSPPPSSVSQAPRNPELAARIAARQEAAAAAAPPADPEAPFDYESELERMIRDAQNEAAELLRASNPRGAQAAQRRASELMKVRAQVEKRKPQDPDLLTFSKQEIEGAMAELETLLAQLCERPVLCSACSRELSIKFGRGGGEGGSPPPLLPQPRP